MKRLKALWRRFLLAFYGSIQRTWKGSTLVLGVVLLLIAFITGTHARIGFGPIIDGLAMTAVVALLIFLTAALLDLVLGILRLLPRPFAAIGGGMAGFMFIFLHMMLDQWIPALLFTAAFCAVQWLLGGALYVLVKQRHPLIPALLIILLGLGLNGAAVGWLLWPGPEPESAVSWQMAAADLSHLSHPGLDGPHSVDHWTYGSGANRRRLEYHPENVRFASTTVDAAPFLPGLSGYREALRRWFWGFDQGAFPLNGLVWFPDGEGPFPLVLVVHGNHQMEAFSDPGYEYLGRFLASRGYITVSVDQNFLNGSWSGAIGTDNDARAWVLLKHLEQWRSWTEDAEHDLYGVVDWDSIALIGHSRGGEAAAIATAFNKLPHYPDDATQAFAFGFSIRAVVAIAPSDGQYLPANIDVPLENFHYLTLQGSLDSDVYLFRGQSAYHRLRFTDDRFWVKAGVYIHGANHGQFNTVWGRKDMPAPLGAILNTAPILEPDLQRAYGKMYIGAFLEGALAGSHQYFDLFRYPGSTAQFAPELPVVSQYKDSTWMPIADFSEDLDVTTTTLSGGTITATGFDIWRQKNPVTQANTAIDAQTVELGWSDTDASYSLHLPENWLAQHMPVPITSLALVIHAADGRTPQKGASPQQISVVLRDENPGSIIASLDQWGQELPLNVRRQFTKAPPLEKMYDSPYEMVPQTFFIPLADLEAAHPDFYWPSWSSIELKFPPASSGRVWIESIGLMEL